MRNTVIIICLVIMHTSAFFHFDITVTFSVNKNEQPGIYCNNQDQAT